MRIAVRRGGGLGDVLLTTPVVRELKRKYPQCELTFITDRNGYLVLKGLPYIDKFQIMSDLNSIHRQNLSGFDRQYSLIYETQPNCHIIDAYAKLAGVTLRNKKPEIVLLDFHHESAQKWMDYHGISDRDFLVAVNRGPTWPCRSWDPSKFKQAAEYLRRKYRAVIVELSGAKGYGAGLGIDLTGKTSIRQTAAVLKRCKLLICVDSFLLHLAGATDTPVVGIFGCTDPKYRLPFNDISIGVQTEGTCRSCYHDGRYKTYCSCFRDRIYCMEEVGVRNVVNAAEILIERLHLI
ncbi:MAG TPA: glycosyltransferase family 9 protein [Clostridiales bacterium]|nr:glycosyltransferase family 9 protein [Clostridiales bacterium]